MIKTLTMNPAIDKTAELTTLQYGELNRLSNVLMDAGGKGINVSKTIAALGGTSLCYGVLAGSAGAFIQEELDCFSIQHNFLMIEGNTRTNLKVLDENKVLTELNESGPTPNQEELTSIKKMICDDLQANDIVVVSGSVPSGVEKTYYYDIIKEAKAKKAKVILDADGELFKEGVKAIPNIIKPNRFELCQYFGVEEIISEEEVIALAKTFIAQGVELVAISQGKDGALFVSKEVVISVDALPIQIHSSVGAGDAMVAAIAYSLDHEYPIEKLVTLAIATSAGACMTQGTKPPTKDLVEKLEAQVVLQYR